MALSRRGVARQMQLRQIARMVAVGTPYKEIASRFGLAAQTIAMYMQDPSFKSLVETYLDRLDTKAEARILEDLIEAEEEALQTMRDLLSSKSDEVKFKAAESLLNRAGKRGKATDRQELATLNLNKPIDQALQAALADPSVRKMLQQRPDLQSALRALPPPEHMDVPAELVQGEQPEFEPSEPPDE